MAIGNCRLPVGAQVIIAHLSISNISIGTSNIFAANAESGECPADTRGFPVCACAQLIQLACPG
jgi:hypothetical protein